MDKFQITSADIDIPLLKSGSAASFDIQNAGELTFDFDAGSVSDDYSFRSAEAEDVSEEEAVSDAGAEREKIEEYLNNTKIEEGGKSYTLGEVLKMCGVKAEDIKPDAFEFISSLDKEAVFQLLSHSSSGGWAKGPDDVMLAKLLTKSGKFENTDFSRLGKNADFLNYLSGIKINNDYSLLERVSDISFFTDENYDTEGMKNLIETIKNAGGFNHGAFGISDLLNSDKINPKKAAESTILLSEKMKKSDAVLLTSYLFPDKLFSERNIDSTECSISDVLNTQNISVIQLLSDKNTDFDKIINSVKLVSKSNIVSDLNNMKMLYMLNPILKKCSSADTGELENIVKLIKLTGSGAAGTHLFERMPEEGNLNPLVSDDISKLYEASEKNLNPIDIFIPEFKNTNEALEKLKTGDVFQTEGEDKIRIKTKDGKSELLNISKETYFKLFPPVERYASTQGQIGNCGQLTAINALLCDADMRASVLKLFSEDKNDILIKIKAGDDVNEIRFKDGKMPEHTNSSLYSKGALGVRMLEYADARSMHMSNIKFVYEVFENRINKESNPEKKAALEKQLAELKEFAAKHDDNIEADLLSNEIFTEYKGNYDNVFTANRVNGTAGYLYKALGYSELEMSFFEGSRNDCKNQLLNPQFFKDNSIILGTRRSSGGIEKPLNPKLGIFSNHAYRLEPGNINSKGQIETYRLINPWSSAFYIELTYEQLIEFGESISTARKP